MNLKFMILFLLVFAISCEKPNPEAQKQNLSGYWEIKSVKMPDGEKKEFDINTVVDYIELKGDSGTRTKVSPKFDGTFTTNGVSENFTLKIEEDSLRMYYKTQFDAWKETVIEAKDSTLTVKNRDNKIYNYSKFKKFDFENPSTKN
ncbi:MAG: lipocalin family protein [Aequorivita sp.]|nr:lipocalin family protein [Aequorivita sp.]MCB0455083.1 lipocalin family protein [Aequorivita sp.]